MYDVVGFMNTIGLSGIGFPCSAAKALHQNEKNKLNVKSSKSIAKFLILKHSVTENGYFSYQILILLTTQTQCRVIDSLLPERLPIVCILKRTYISRSSFVQTLDSHLVTGTRQSELYHAEQAYMHDHQSKEDIRGSKMRVI